MLGITHLRVLIFFVLATTADAVNALSDGFQPWKDITTLLPDVMQIPAIVATKDDILKEFNDLDETEAAQLKTEIAAKFNIPNERVAFVVEKALGSGLGLMALINEFKAIKAANSSAGTAQA